MVRPRAAVVSRLCRYIDTATPVLWSCRHALSRLNGTLDPERMIRAAATGRHITTHARITMAVIQMVGVSDPSQANVGKKTGMKTATHITIRFKRLSLQHAIVAHHELLSGIVWRKVVRQ